MTTNDYASFKNEALSSEPYRIKAHLAEIKFADPRHIEYKNTLLALTEHAVRDLESIFGLTRNFSHKLEKEPERVAHLMNTVKTAIARTPVNSVFMSVSRTKKILRILPESAGLLSYEAFFHLCERVISKNNLETGNLSVNAQGELVVTTKTAEHEFMVKGFSEEVFQPGLSFSNTHEGIFCDPYLLRMVCSNGMIARQFTESVRLKTLDYKSADKFFNDVDRIEKRNFVPSSFTAKIRQAIETKASLLELERAAHLLPEVSDIDKDLVEKFIPYKKILSDYKSIGVEAAKLSASKKRNAGTGVTIWQMINGITDFASNEHGFNFKEGGRQLLQIKAGDMLCKTFDMANLVAVTPYR